MADKTEIAWCDSTFNPWIGCTKIGAGCDHCYAEADFDHRKHRVKWGAGQARSRTSPANWKKPLRWNRADFRECRDCGWRGEVDTLVDDTCPSCGKHEHLEPARRRVFCASLADVFDNEVPVEWRMDLFSLIANTPNLDWLILTKRVGNVMPMCSGDSLMFDMIGRRVWLGITVCNQAEADRDIPKLLQIPASKLWLSMEPLLDHVDLWALAANSLHTLDGGPKIDWVVVGGESGSKARPMHPDWVRSLRDQCSEANVPFLFKQWGEWAPNWYNDADGNKIDGSEWMDRMGKKTAGRLLDGVLHDAYPGGAA